MQNDARDGEVCKGKEKSRGMHATPIHVGWTTVWADDTISSVREQVAMRAQRRSQRYDSLAISHGWRRWCVYVCVLVIVCVCVRVRESVRVGRWD
jgi:hypothetical protein